MAPESRGDQHRERQPPPESGAHGPVWPAAEGSRAQGRRQPILFGRTGWSLPFVFCLYAYQGLVAGFGLTALSNHHAGLGATDAAVAWHAVVVGLPWVLQPAW